MNFSYTGIAQGEWKGGSKGKGIFVLRLINPLIKFKPFSLSFSRGTKPDLQTDNFHGGNVILSLSVLSLFQMKSKKIRPFHFAEHYFQLVFNRCSIHYLCLNSLR